MGEEDVTAYNARVEAAFEARRIIACRLMVRKYKIEEVSKDIKTARNILIDNWCLVASHKDDCNVG